MRGGPHVKGAEMLRVVSYNHGCLASLWYHANIFTHEGINKRKKLTKRPLYCVGSLD